jgi:hypothetical protein
MKADEITRALLASGGISVNLTSGCVYSHRFLSPRLLGCLNVRGYLVATLHHGQHRVQVKLHRVVWLASGQEIPHGFVIDHINRQKADNRLSNLRLADALLNSQNRRSYAGQENPAARITAADANAIRCLHDNGESYSLIASKFDVSKSLVAQIARGEIW